jgi:hypothetical protein
MARFLPYPAVCDCDICGRLRNDSLLTPGACRPVVGEAEEPWSEPLREMVADDVLLLPAGGG